MQTFNDIPQNLADNDTVLAILFVIMLMAIVSTGRLWQFIQRQTHAFFYRQKSDKVYSETSGELHFQIFLTLLTCLVIALDVCLLTGHSDTPTLMKLFALVAAVIMVKVTLYSITGHLFFDDRRNGTWFRALAFLTAVQGVALMPAVMIQIFQPATLTAIAVYTAVIIVGTKAMTAVKTWNIYFHDNRQTLQAALYFTAIEAVPLLAAVAIAINSGIYA